MTNTLLSALVNGAITAAILAGVVRLSLALVPRTMLRATGRYAIWWTILVSTWVMPLAYLPTRPMDPTVHSVGGLRQTSAAPTASAPVIVSKPLAVKRRPGRAIGLALPLRITANGAPRWLVIGWAILSAVFFFRLIASLCFLARRRSGAVVAPPELARSVEASLLAHRSSRRAVVMTSPTITAPVLAGLRRPTILIPERLLAELSQSELIAIVLHEAAHVVRRDDYALLAERLIQSALPLHPVVWWIFRQIGLERELACYAAAVETFGSARRYAACLVHVMELCSGARVSWAAARMAAGRSQLAHRVETLLAAGRQSSKQSCRLRLLTAIAITAAFACFAFQTPQAVAFSTPPAAQQPPRRGAEVIAPEITNGQDVSKDLPVITIRKDGATYLNDQPCNVHDFGKAIRRKFGKPEAVYIRADKETIYDVVVQVCNQLRKDGLKVKLVMPTETSHRGFASGFSIQPAQQPPTGGLAPLGAAPVLPAATAIIATRPVNSDQPHSSFVPAAENRPLSVALVVDRSGSMSNKSDLVDDAIAALTKSANPADEFLLVAFNSAIDVAGPFTNDSARIFQQLHRDTPRGGTSLRDAIASAVRWSGARYPNRALIVISDGDDNSSSITAAQLRDAVIPANVPVWAITLTGSRAHPRPRWLGDLATETHGREFVTDDPNEVAATASQLIQMGK